MKTAIALFLAAAAMIGSAFAQTEPVTNPGGTIPNVSFSSIAPILQEMGNTVEETAFAEENVLKVTTASGRTVILLNRACSDTNGCAGLWMMAYLSDTAPMEMINYFNQQNKPVRAVQNEGEKVMLDRYLIADYGTTRGSFAIDFNVFVSMIDTWYTIEQEAAAQ